MNGELVELGDLVRDPVTGLEGIAIARAKGITGVPRIGIQQPLDKEGKVRESWDIDETQLLIIERRKIKAQPALACPVSCGDEVEDTVTGFRGIVTTAVIFLNGCTRLVVQPKKNKDGKLPSYVSFDMDRLKILKKRKVPELQQKTGGPMTRSEVPSA